MCFAWHISHFFCVFGFSINFLFNVLTFILFMQRRKYDSVNWTKLAVFSFPLLVYGYSCFGYFRKRFIHISLVISWLARKKTTRKKTCRIVHKIVYNMGTNCLRTDTVIAGIENNTDILAIKKKQIKFVNNSISCDYSSFRNQDFFYFSCSGFVDVIIIWSLLIGNLLPNYQRWSLRIRWAQRNSSIW